MNNHILLSMSYLFCHYQCIIFIPIINTLSVHYLFFHYHYIYQESSRQTAVSIPKCHNLLAFHGRYQPVVVSPYLIDDITVTCDASMSASCCPNANRNACKWAEIYLQKRMLVFMGILNFLNEVFRYFPS